MASVQKLVYSTKTETYRPRECHRDSSVKNLAQLVTAGQNALKDGDKQVWRTSVVTACLSARRDRRDEKLREILAMPEGETNETWIETSLFETVFDQRMVSYRKFAENVSFHRYIETPRAYTRSRVGFVVFHLFIYLKVTRRDSA